MPKYRINKQRTTSHLGFSRLSPRIPSHAASRRPLRRLRADTSTVAYDSTADLDMLCGKMGYMQGCSVRNACKIDDLQGACCKDWSLLSNTCSTTHGEMMQNMGGCANYVKLCREGSKVEGCYTGIPKLITTNKLVEDTAAACTAAADTISECAKCKTKMAVPTECPDPLRALSKSCLEAPDSAPCTNWKTLCGAAATGLEAFCGASSVGSIPSASVAVTLAAAAAAAAALVML